MNIEFYKTFFSLATPAELAAMQEGKKARKFKYGKDVPWNLRLYANWYLIGYSL